MKEWFENIVVFDGTCNLCIRAVSFIIRHDKRAVFRFATVRSAAGRRLCQCFGVDPDQFDTAILFQRNGVCDRSDAALAIVTTFGGPWRLLAVVRFVPRPVRDWVYGVVARHRYSFSRQKVCLMPSDEVRNRFIE